MAGDITLSNAVRSNLLSLQNTADLLARTQERLSTGKKVNSALDNPTNFFTASALTARSGDLNSLLDGVSNGIQALQAADKGITSITKLVESAQATARQALQTSGGDVAYNMTTYGSVSVAADTAATVTGIVNMRAGPVIDTAATTTGAAITPANLAAATTFEINGTTIDLTALTAASTAADVQGLINAQTATTGVAATVTGGAIVLTAADTDTDIVLGGNAATLTAAGLTAGTWSATASTQGGYGTATQTGTTVITNDTISDLSGETLSLSYGSNSFTFTFGSGQGQINNLDSFNIALAQASASVNGDTITGTGTGGAVTAADAAGYITTAAAAGDATFQVNAAGNLVVKGDDTNVVSSINLKGTSSNALSVLGFAPADASSPIVEVQADNLLKELGLKNGDTLTFQLGKDSPTQTIVFGTGNGQVNSRDGLIRALDRLPSLDATQTGADGNRIKITAANSNEKLIIGGSAREEIFGASVMPEGTNGNIPSNTVGQTNSELSILEGQQISVQLGDGSVNTITLGTTNGRVGSRADLLEKLNDISPDLKATFDSAGRLKFQSTSQYDLKISGNGASALGLQQKAYSPTATVNSSSKARESLQKDFNYTLSQITTLAQDASYNGINLLTKDNLKVTFNENGSSQLNIEGVDFTKLGLGLSDALGDDFQKDATINSFLDKMGEALSTLRTQASKFGSNLAIVETRQDFTKNLINVLDAGAANLTLADSTAEAANSLALQTRQSLGTTALSLSNQADQSILQLLR